MSVASHTLTPPAVYDPTISRRLGVLVVDDDRALREGCASFFGAHGHGVTATGSGNEALALVSRRGFDVILLDLHMSQVPGMEILKAALVTAPHTLVVMMTGNPSVESNLRAVQHGAWDYMLKPFTPAHLDVLMGRAVQALAHGGGAPAPVASGDGAGTPYEEAGADGHRAAGGTGMAAPRAVVRPGNRSASGGECIGSAPAFRAAVELARRTAATDASVMLSGESGTGKEVLADLIHRCSRRATRRMVPVNCAALPDSLLESEMFGHRKGAFTGADRDKPGLLEMAHGGTLFLDELTEMSQRLQAKLLRVLQDGVVRRVGSEHQNATVDVRFVSATNRDPHEAVRSGVLREDLFYRLRVVLIKLPPLRERLDDIPLLATHFLAHYWARYRAPSDTLPRFSAACLDLLRSRSWRGNVRELQNVVEHVAVLAEPGQPIQPDDIPFYDGDDGSTTDSPVPIQLLDERYYAARDTLMSNFEYAYLSRLISRTGGNMSKAARTAGLDRTTFYRLLGRHSLRREDRETHAHCAD